MFKIPDLVAVRNGDFSCIRFNLRGYKLELCCFAITVSSNQTDSFTAGYLKVKIGKKEYELESLSSLDLKKIEKAKKENKLEDYDYSYFIILYAVKKFNKDVTMTLEEFEESFPLKKVADKFVEIGDIIGLDFKAGIGKSLDGKTQ